MSYAKRLADALDQVAKASNDYWRSYWVRRLRELADEARTGKE